MAAQNNDIPDESCTEGGTSEVDLVTCRPRWLRRLGVGAGLLLVGLILLRGLWGLAADHRLAAQVEQYRSAGQLVDAEEFDAELDAVVESRNAAALLEKAMDSITTTTASGVCLSSFLDDLSDFDKSLSEARELMYSNADVLALVRQARHLPDVAWSARLGNPESGAFRGSQQRSLARLLWLAVSYHFRTGDHASAVATMQDYLAFNKAVDSYPTLISSLVAWACYDLSFSLIEEYGGDLGVADAGEGSEAIVTPASREQVQELAWALLSEQSMHENVVRSYHGARSSLFHTLETGKLLDWTSAQSLGPLDCSPFKQVVTFVLHPVLVLDTARDARYYTLASEAVAEPTWPEAARHFQAEPVNAHLLYRLTRPITHTQFGTGNRSMQRSVQVFFKTLARRRMAATALAIQLYAADHGKRPAELTALVPRYIGELPRDPFAISGGSLGYRPLAERALLYSVGPDGRDNEGQVVRGPDGRLDREKSDILFYLDAKKTSESAAGASIPEADDNDEDVDQGQGQQPQK
jgi:hypothetical protein